MKDFEQFLLKSVGSNSALNYLMNISVALNELVEKKSFHETHAIMFLHMNGLRKRYDSYRINTGAGTKVGHTPYKVIQYFYFF